MKVFHNLGNHHISQFPKHLCIFCLVYSIYFFYFSLFLLLCYSIVCNSFQSIDNMLCVCAFYYYYFFMFEYPLCNTFAYGLLWYFGSDTVGHEIYQWKLKIKIFGITHFSPSGMFVCQEWKRNWKYLENIKCQWSKSMQKYRCECATNSWLDLWTFISYQSLLFSPIQF